MNWLSSFLHPERGYEKAQNELDKYWNQAQQFQQPFINNSQSAYGGLSEALQHLLNPSGLQDEWLKNYNESDYTKNLESEATDRGLSAASSLGIMGSPALSAIQRGTQSIQNQARQKYLDDLMQKYLAGIGLGQNIYGTGANAAGNLSNAAGQFGANSAQTAFGQENAPGNLLSKLLEGGVSFATPFAQAWGLDKLGVRNAPWSTTGGH